MLTSLRQKKGSSIDLFLALWCQSEGKSAIGLNLEVHNIFTPAIEPKLRFATADEIADQYGFIYEPK